MSDSVRRIKAYDGLSHARVERPRHQRVSIRSSRISRSSSARQRPSGRPQNKAIVANLQRGWRQSRGIRRVWGGPFLTLVGALVVIAGLAVTLPAQPAARASTLALPGTVASPEVRTVVSLGSPDLHPEQLAYDPHRNGMWFWTSVQDRGLIFTNRVYFYDIARRRLTSWPIYSGDWSSLLHAGLGVAPNGDVWIGWNHNLVDFHPSDGSYKRYSLPAHAQYPLPSAVLRDLPADLGVTDLAIAPDGTVWIALYGALSLTEFSPKSRTFGEHPLPSNAGDPAKLAIGHDGDVYFITNFSADHPGYGAEKVGDYDPRQGVTHIFQHGALAFTVTPQGDIYTALSSPGFGLGRLTSSERVSAEAQRRSPTFEEQMVPFAIDDRAITSDRRGRIWLAMSGRPELAVLDPSTGSVERFQYHAAAITAWPTNDYAPSSAPRPPAPGAVWLVHITVMATDAQGHLWYIREGSDTLEEVVA